jgi:Zn-dependent alcohol dehydrogenases
MTNVSEKMQAAVVSEPGAEFDLVDRPVPEPNPDEVRIAVEACGICHSDVFVKEGTYPGVEYPRVPGHEVAGRIDAVGADVICGRLMTALVLGGMVVTASTVIHAGVVTFNMC